MKYFSTVCFLAITLGLSSGQSCQGPLVKFDGTESSAETAGIIVATCLIENANVVEAFTDKVDCLMKCYLNYSGVFQADGKVNVSLLTSLRLKI
jgi:hypothetical protein